MKGSAQVGREESRPAFGPPGGSGLPRKSLALPWPCPSPSSDSTMRSLGPGPPNLGPSHSKDGDDAPQCCSTPARNQALSVQACHSPLGSCLGPHHPPGRPSGHSSERLPCLWHPHGPSSLLASGFERPLHQVAHLLTAPSVGGAAGPTTLPGLSRGQEGGGSWGLPGGWREEKPAQPAV